MPSIHVKRAFRVVLAHGFPALEVPPGLHHDMTTIKAHAAPGGEGAPIPETINYAGAEMPVWEALCRDHWTAANATVLHDGEEVPREKKAAELGELPSIETVQKVMADAGRAWEQAATPETLANMHKALNGLHVARLNDPEGWQDALRSLAGGRQPVSEPEIARHAAMAASDAFAGQGAEGGPGDAPGGFDVEATGADDVDEGSPTLDAVDQRRAEREAQRGKRGRGR